MTLPFRRRPVFRSPSTVSLPYVLRRGGIYIFPTRYGFLFILVLAGMLLGSANYNNNLGFLLTFLLGSMAFVSILHTHRNLSGIEIRSAAPQPVFAGDRAVCRLRITAGDRSRPALEFGFAGEPAARRSLSERQEARVDTGLQTAARGILKPGPLVIATRYPLGLFRAWTRLDTGVAWTVYPTPVQGPEAFQEEDSGKTTHAAGKKATRGVEDFHGLRHYQPGDLPRHISWKSYARGQGLLTKVFTGKTGSTVMLDWRLLGEEETERKLSRLSGLVLRAGASGRKYGLNLPGKTIPPDRGAPHKHECLRTLALFGLPRRTP